MIELHRTEGVGAAFRAFMVHAGYGEDAPMPPGEPSAQDLADSARFFAHELRGTARWRPDAAALTAGPARVVVGVGVESTRLLTWRTSHALAELLGTPPVEFPGDHGGFMFQPEEFAKTLRTVLADG